MVKKHLARHSKFRRYDIRQRRLVPRNGITTALFYSPTAFELTHHPNLELPRKAASISRGSSGANNKKTLFDLPPELLLTVSKHLEIEGLYYFAQTCTYVCGAVGKHLYNERGQHLLLWAASEGKLARAQKVVTHGKKININFKESGLTALALVIENYTPERKWSNMKSLRMEKIDFTSTAELLLNHPDIDLEDETNGINMLKTAIQTGFGLAVDRLLRYCPSAVNAALDGFGTPLTFAASLGRTDIIKLLIGRRADVNLRNGVGHTALAQAVFARKHEAANFLLEQRNTDLSKETNGIDVLEKAIENDLYPVVERLLQYHHVNTPFDNGQTPLVTAAQWGREKTVDLLVRSGANVNQLTIQHSFDTGITWTALSMAAKHGHESIVRQLLRCEDIQTDLNSADLEESGDAVYWAAANRQYNCVVSLLRSDRVSYSAEQIDQLLEKIKSTESGRFGDYSTIYKVLRACQGTNSPKSRQANLKSLTAAKLREAEFQAFLAAL